MPARRTPNLARPAAECHLIPRTACYVRRFRRIESAIVVARMSILGLAAWLLASLPAAGQPALAFKVIANERVAGTKIPRRLLGDIFLKKVARWGDGVEIAAVDQSTTSPVRASFSQDVLGQPIVAVQHWWAQQIGAGLGRPPVVKGSDATVIAFVAAHPGGIGYVAADAALSEGVKAMSVE